MKLKCPNSFLGPQQQLLFFHSKWNRISSVLSLPLSAIAIGTSVQWCVTADRHPFIRLLCVVISSMYSMYFVHTCSLMYLKVSLPEGVLRVMKVERCEYMTQDTHMHVLLMYVTSASDYHFLSIRTALCYTVRWFCTHLVNVSGVCLCKTCRYNVWAFLVFAWA